MRRLVLTMSGVLAIATLALPSSAAPSLSGGSYGLTSSMAEPVYHRPGHRPRPPRDCHRDVRRHFVPGYGRVPHRHVGPRCRVDVGRRYRDRDRDCIRIGDLRICT